MTKEELRDLIKKTFGRYRRPKTVTGFPPEPWQDRLAKLPLCQLSLEDMDDAVMHVFPGHYGNKDIFCYLLSRILTDFLFDSLQQVEEKTKRLLGKRCAQWKSQLLPTEIDVITLVFQYASFKAYCSSGVISSYYFIFFLLWHKDIDEVLNYFSSNYSEEAVDALKYDMQYVIEYYQDIPEFSPLAAILGTYYIQEGFGRTVDDDTKYRWFHDSIWVDEEYMSKYFSPIEMDIIDMRIKELFV